MKKYRVIQKGNGAIFGEFETRVEAAKKIMEYLNDLNDGGVVILSPFDFVLEEVECEEVNEIITDFEAARERLGGKPNMDFTVSQKVVSRNAVRLEDVTRLVQSLNPSHIEALIALNELFTIAQAWNKADGFAPDFWDWNQAKYYPWFKYDKDGEGFVFASTGTAPSYACAPVCSRLCFKTSERAAQFGKQFIELYNKVFL